MTADTNQTGVPANNDRALQNIHDRGSVIITPIRLRQNEDLRRQSCLTIFRSLSL